jgi:hypothetical protein
MGLPSVTSAVFLIDFMVNHGCLGGMFEFATSSGVKLEWCVCNLKNQAVIFLDKEILLLKYILKSTFFGRFLKPRKFD